MIISAFDEAADATEKAKKLLKAGVSVCLCSIIECAVDVKLEFLLSRNIASVNHPSTTFDLISDCSFFNFRLSKWRRRRRINKASNERNDKRYQTLCSPQKNHIAKNICFDKTEKKFFTEEQCASDHNIKFSGN